MSRTPYSPLVEKARAPLPWKAGRGVGRSVEFRVISSGLSLRAPGWSRQSRHVGAIGAGRADRVGAAVVGPLAHHRSLPAINSWREAHERDLRGSNRSPTTNTHAGGELRVRQTGASSGHL